MSETKPTEPMAAQKLREKIQELRKQHYQQCATLGDFHFMLKTLPGKITQTEDKIRNLIVEIEKAEAKSTANLQELSAQTAPTDTMNEVSA